MQMPVQRVRRQQLLVRPRRDDFPLVDQMDGVARPQRGHLVRQDDCRPPRRQPRRGSRVERRSRGSLCGRTSYARPGSIPRRAAGERTVRGRAACGACCFRPGRASRGSRLAVGADRLTGDRRVHDQPLFRRRPATSHRGHRRPAACPSGEPRAGLDGRRSWRGRATTQPRELPVRATVPWLAGMEPRWKEQAQVGDALARVALLRRWSRRRAAGLASLLRLPAVRQQSRVQPSARRRRQKPRQHVVQVCFHGSTSSRLQTSRR